MDELAIGTGHGHFVRERAVRHVACAGDIDFGEVPIDSKARRGEHLCPALAERFFPGADRHVRVHSGPVFGIEQVRQPDPRSANALLVSSRHPPPGSRVRLPRASRIALLGIEPA